MKGLVFTELLQMAEAHLGEDAVDDILDGLSLENDGAYTAVGNYPCAELVRIVGAVSDHSGLPADDLQRMFGKHMLGRFVASYPHFFADKSNVLDMLDAIENEVHVEVRKLYPDAELPSFDTQWQGRDALRMVYRSERPLVAFCHGLIEACADHFGQAVTVDVTQNPDANASEATFLVRLAG